MGMLAIVWIPYSRHVHIALVMDRQNGRGRKVWLIIHSSCLLPRMLEMSRGVLTITLRGSPPEVKSAYASKCVVCVCVVCSCMCVYMCVCMCLYMCVCACVRCVCVCMHVCVHVFA